MRKKNVQKKKISSINLRSFSKLSAAVQAIVGRIINNPFSCGLGSLISFLAATSLRLLGGEIDSVTAFRKLKGDKCVFWVRTDEMIPYPAQMQAALDDHTISSVELDASLPQPHNRFFTEDELKILYDQIAKMLHLSHQGVIRFGVIRISSEKRISLDGSC